MFINLTKTLSRHNKLRALLSMVYVLVHVAIYIVNLTRAIALECSPVYHI